MLWTILTLGAIGLVGWIAAEVISRRQDATVIEGMEHRHDLTGDPYAQQHGAIY